MPTKHLITRVKIEIDEHMGIKDRKTVRKYLNALIEQGRITRTVPDKPNSQFQKYVIMQIRKGGEDDGKEASGRDPGI